MIEYKMDIEGISPDMLDGFFDGGPIRRALKNI